MDNKDFQSAPAKEKKEFSLSSLIYNDKYLVVVSIFLAVLVWIGTSLSVGTNETKVVKFDAPIKLSDKMSEELGMKYFSLQDNVNLSVTISGAKYVIGQVTPEDLTVSFDTSGINRIGEQSVPIRVTNKSKILDFEVTSVSPSTLDCYFDVEASKTLKIETRYDEDAVADGYTFGTPVLSEDTVVVSGPKAYVNNIKNAYVDVDFDDKTDLTEPYTMDCDIKLEGSNIGTNYLELTTKQDEKQSLNNIQVSIPVLKETTLPITSSFENKPAGLPNDAVTVSYSKSSIFAGVLKSADITNANIGTIDFNSLLPGTQTFEFKTNDISGAYVLDGTDSITATVKVNPNYSAKKVYISKSKVQIENAKTDSNLSVRYLKNSNITVIVPNGTDIKAADLTLKCDVSKVNKDNTYPVDITVNNDKCWVYGTYEAVIK